MVYVIYAKRKDSIIKIVSKKKMINECNAIKIGHFYPLKVESLLKHTASKRHIGGVKFNGTLIKLEGENVVWDLFVCENLNGLCFNPATSTKCKNKRKKATLVTIFKTKELI
jgi:hypothetical protein